MSVLVAVPIREEQVDRWGPNVCQRFTALTYPDKELAMLANTFVSPTKKYGPNAAARNLVLDRCLRSGHTHVLWIDADLVKVPADLIEQLLAVSSRDVVAPFVYVEPPGGWFYDTGGFVKNGVGAAPHGPIFPGYAGGVIELDSVGTCYLAPAALYSTHGLRYRVAGNEVEHRGLLAQARSLGYRVLATDAVKVEHAYLPNHGEHWHSE